MNNTSIRLARLDRFTGILLAAVILGSLLGFGGEVWWGRAFVALPAALLLFSTILRFAFSGGFVFLGSPLGFLGLLGIAVGLAQVAPWPAEVVRKISPHTGVAQSHGLLPSVAEVDDSSFPIPEPFLSRMPLSLDRSATLRASVSGLLCLVVFWAASHYTDRLSRLYFVWGCVVTVFVINGAFALIQVAGGSDGLYGAFHPGRGPSWAPSLADAAQAPGESVFRLVSLGQNQGGGLPDIRPVPTFAFGAVPGGADAYLALASVALPLALAMALQLMAPRGSRVGLRARLQENGHRSVFLLLIISLMLTSVIVGLFSGVVGAIPYVATALMVGLCASFSTGLGWRSLLLSVCVAGAIAGAAKLGDDWERLMPAGATPPRATTFERAAVVWKDCKAILADFPIVGVGLGAFPTVYPYYKSTDVSSTTAMSDVLTWTAETGAVGAGLLGLAVLWCLFRIPGACFRVGGADRALAFGCVGFLACFGFASLTRWTADCLGIAVAVSAVGGTLNRWLAGGTDLFLEQG